MITRPLSPAIRRFRPLLLGLALGALSACSGYEFGGPVGSTQYMGPVAAAHGVSDYRGQVASAMVGDAESIGDIMKLTPYAENEAFIEQARVLYNIIERVGDQKFARTLESQPPKIRASVGDAIKRHIYFLKPGVDANAVNTVFEEAFPLTYNAI